VSPELRKWLPAILQGAQIHDTSGKELNEKCEHEERITWAECTAVFERITELKMNYNALGAEGARALAPALEKMTQMSNLSLDGNDVDVPTKDIYPSVPEEVLVRGWMATLKYIWELEAQGRVLCYGVRVQLMGDGKAGKTSLVHALLKEGVTEVIAEDNRTVGIDIVEMLLGPQVKARLFDMAGQQDYAIVNAAFTTPRCLVLVVWRPDQPRPWEHVQKTLRRLHACFDVRIIPLTASRAARTTRSASTSSASTSPVSDIATLRRCSFTPATSFATCPFTRLLSHLTLTLLTAFSSFLFIAASARCSSTRCA